MQNRTQTRKSKAEIKQISCSKPAANPHGRGKIKQKCGRGGI
jgi:hypothetical protein